MSTVRRLCTDLKDSSSSSTVLDSWQVREPFDGAKVGCCIPGVYACMTLWSGRVGVGMISYPSPMERLQVAGSIVLRRVPADVTK